MKIEWQTLPTDFKGETCFTHARGVITPGGFGLITAQPLRLSGSDIFYGMYLSKTYDGGKTWGEEFIICVSDQPKHWDLGYPSTVELDDGTLITSTYQAYQNDKCPSVLYTRWRLEESAE